MGTPAKSESLSSVDRAISMLEALAESGSLTATQLARRLDTGKATAFRLARSLVARGWVVQDRDRSYRLGPGALTLAVHASATLDLRTQLLAVMHELHEATGETIHLTKLDGRHIVYLEQLMSPQPVLSVAMLGSKSPAHCVSPGLAQLACLPAAQLDWVLAGELERHTPATLTDPDALRQELANVRQRGYAVNRGAFRPEVGGVGIAVTDDRGLPVAGLSICMPVYRLDDKDIAALGALLQAVAAKAKQHLRDEAARPPLGPR
ncbi:MAG: helix-turn-helix domain-containing protein [Streptosporangiales bacterium]|nr:helix-turn-helix domain-containing protein [Streptosporangiales bacterium]